MSDRNYPGQDAYGVAAQNASGAPGAGGGIATFRPPAQVTPLRGPGSLSPLRAPYALSVGGAPAPLQNALPFAAPAAIPSTPIPGAPFGGAGAYAPPTGYAASGYAGAAPPTGYSGPPAGGAYPAPPAMLAPMPVGTLPTPPTPLAQVPPPAVVQPPAVVPPPAVVAKPVGATTDPIGVDLKAQIAEKAKPAVTTDPIGTDINGDLATEIMAVKLPTAPAQQPSSGDVVAGAAGARPVATVTADAPAPVLDGSASGDARPMTDGAAADAGVHGPGPSPWAVTNARVQAENLPSAHVVARAREEAVEEEAPRRKVAPPPPSRTGRSSRTFIVLLVFLLVVAAAALAFVVMRKHVSSNDPISIGVKEDGTPIMPSSEAAESATATAPTASASAKPKFVAPPPKPRSNDDVYRPPPPAPASPGKYNPTDL